MSDKAMILLGAALLALGVSGCTKPETTTKTVARKPLDTKLPLAPQLFPTPATNNAWFHVITTSDELKFNAKLSQTDDVTNVAKSSPKERAKFFSSKDDKCWNHAVTSSSSSRFLGQAYFTRIAIVPLARSE